MKTCRRCNILKEFSEFYKNITHKDGFRSECKKCSDISSKIYNELNPEINAASKKAYRDRNIDQIKIDQQNYKQNNPGKVKNTKQLWKKSNIGKVNANTAKRRAAKLQRTPRWLNEIQLLEIQYFYTLTKELQWLANEPLEVDHIVPLQGKNVSGLHVPWNLQILPAKTNSAKKNNF
jgi:hypothetical protein